MIVNFSINEIFNEEDDYFSRTIFFFWIGN